MAEALPSRRIRGIAGWAVLVLALAVLVSLGNWQMRRLAWKESLIAEIATRTAASAETADAIAARVAKGETVDFRHVAVSGTYRHEAEHYFFTTFDGQSGFDVLTPLVLADGRVVIVNRGFVPYDRKDPATRAAGQLTGDVSVTGLARDAVREKPGFLVPDNDLTKNIFYWKDFDQLAKASGLDPAKVLPFLIDADPVAGLPGGWPKGGATILELPNSHLQYALTWYGLAAALVGVVVAARLRRRKRDLPDKA